MTLALDRFAKNRIKANPSKFQTVIFKHRSNEAICELNILNNAIKPVRCVKLSGVILDDELCLDDHISRLCTTAALQTNALRRIIKYAPHACVINTLRPGQNGCHFPDVIFKWFFLMKMYKFCLRIHRNLFLYFEFTIFYHWFRWWLGID